MSEHESSGDKPREIGLRAVRDARVERTANKHGRITGKTWLVVGTTALTVVGAALLYQGRSLANQKEELLSKQRAALATVGAEWSPLQERIAKTTVDAAGPYQGDHIDPELASWDFRTAPGIYLRLRAEDAKDPAQLRKLAEDSARDAFVGCLFRENNPSQQAVARGEPDAGSGWHDQPWNLRLAFYATRMLTDEWATEVKDAADEIHLRVFVQQYEKATKEEIPLAVDIVKKAQFFLLVLDEDVPEAQALAPDAGRSAGKVTWRELQQVPHPARVHLVDLRTGKEVLRLRRESDASFKLMGEGQVRDPRVLAAMQRQVNNCALAEDVWAAIHPASANAGRPR